MAKTAKTVTPVAAPTTAAVTAKIDPKLRTEALKRVEELGRKAGDGDLSMGELFVQTVKDSDTGIIKAEKIGAGGDDADLYASKYNNARAKAGLGEAKDTVIKKNASMLRQGIKAGALSTVNFPKTCTGLYKAFADIRKAGGATKTLIEAYTSAAREQLNQPNIDLSPDQIKTCCLPFPKSNSEGGEKSRVDELIAIRKKLEKMHTKAVERKEEDTAIAVESMVSDIGDVVDTLNEDEQKEYAAKTTKKEKAPASNAKNTVAAKEAKGKADANENDGKSNVALQPQVDAIKNEKGNMAAVAAATTPAAPLLGKPKVEGHDAKLSITNGDPVSKPVAVSPAPKAGVASPLGKPPVVAAKAPIANMMEGSVEDILARLFA
jgi:hypothetical protein